MLIDEPQKIKQKLLKLIALPTNQEVIYYDSGLIDLAKIDVQKLYKDKIREYYDLQDKFSRIKFKLDKYEERFKNMSLAGKNMTEQDYIKEIQKLEIEYSKDYSKIKQLESKINSIKSAIMIQQEKIEIQKAKDSKEISGRNEKINLENEKLDRELSIVKAKKQILQIEISGVKSIIETYREKAKILGFNKIMAGNGMLKCTFCGSEIDIADNQKEVSKKIGNEIGNCNLRIGNQMQILSQKQKQLEEAVLKEKEIEQKIESNKKNKVQPYIYVKKSKEVLRLESAKFKMQDELQNLTEQYAILSKNEGKKFTNMKQKLDDYKNSLSNLISLKDEKDSLKEEMQLSKDLQEEINQLESALKVYAKFLMIRNKMIEKRMSDIFDGIVTFQFYKLDNIYIKDENKIFYKNIEVQFLNLSEQNELEDLIQEKIKYV